MWRYVPNKKLFGFFKITLQIPFLRLQKSCPYPRSYGNRDSFFSHKARKPLKTKKERPRGTPFLFPTSKLPLFTFRQKDKNVLLGKSAIPILFTYAS